MTILFFFFAAAAKKESLSVVRLVHCAMYVGDPSLTILMALEGREEQLLPSQVSTCKAYYMYWVVVYVAGSNSD